MPNKDFVTGKIDAEIRRINSIIADRETNISILKSDLKGHPPPRIEYDIRRKIKNLEEYIDSIKKDRTRLRKQRDKLKSEKIKRSVQAPEAINEPIETG